MTRLTPGTMVLLLLNVVMFVAFDLRDGANALDAGSAQTALVAGGAYWRLIAANFVHYGFFHLLLNCYFLYMVGPMLEQGIETDRFLALYLVAGVGGLAFATLLAPPNAAVAGGSAALFGMLGAILAILARQSDSLGDLRRNRLWRVVVSVLLINFALGLMIPNVSNAGHLGGLVTGFAFAFCVLRLPDPSGRVQRPGIGRVAAFALSFTALVLLTCRPFVKPWFVARELWFAGDARAAELRPALVTQGVDEAVVAWLDLCRTARAGLDDDAVLRAVLELRGASARRDRIDRGLARLHADPTRFNPFLRALAGDRGGAAALLPRDPWSPRRR